MWGLTAGIPYVVGAVREGYALLHAKIGGYDRALVDFDKAARAELASVGVAEISPVGILPGSVTSAAASFRAAMPDISPAALRLVLAQTNLESSFGHGWGPGCWNMGAEQCGPGGKTADYDCVDHGDSHSDGSKYTAKYKCFPSQVAATTGYLRLLHGPRYTDAWAGAEKGDVSAFVHGLYIHKDAQGKDAGGWFEGIGNTDAKRWGGELAGLLARLPAIDAALGGVPGSSSTGPAVLPVATQKAALPAYSKSIADEAVSQPADTAPAAILPLPNGMSVAQVAQARAYAAQNPGAVYQAQGGTLEQAAAQALRESQGGQQFQAQGGASGTPPAGGSSQFQAQGGLPPADAQVSGVITGLFLAMLAGWGVVTTARVSAMVGEIMGRLAASGIEPIAPGRSVTAGHSLVAKGDPGLVQAFDGRADWLASALEDGWTYQRPNLGTGRAAVAGVGSQSMAGLMLTALLSGQAINADSYIEIEVPELDLVVTTLRRAMRAPVTGYAEPLILGFSYADQIKMCNAMGWISPTREMVDAAYHDPSVWRLRAEGLWVPGANISDLTFAAKHTANVDAQMAALGVTEDGAIRGPCKAWIIDARLPTSKGAVNYGFFSASGVPEQTVGGKHDALHADYSQCEPPVQRTARILSTGEAVDLLSWYRRRFPDPKMAPFLDAYEGAVA